MPEARLEVTLPEGVWIGELTREFPDAQFRILAALSSGDAGVGLAEIHSESLAELLERMAAYEDVIHLDVLNEPDESALVQFETTLPLLLLPARDSGVPLEMPFDLSNGSAVWEVTAPSDRLSELGAQLKAFDISFTIDYIQHDIDKERLLTDSQRDILERAIELGYYNTPRGCSLTELASEVGRAKSTVSETLHRAEGKVIKEFVGEDGPEQGAVVTPGR